jgi:hypothetical protein
MVDVTTGPEPIQVVRASRRDWQGTSLTMPMKLSRNVVMSVWFAVFAIATILASAVSSVFSLFFLVLGLAVPMMVYVLWHAPRVAVGLVAQSTDTERRQATGNS